MFIYVVRIIDTDYADLTREVAQLSGPEISAVLSPPDSRGFDGEIGATLTLVVPAVSAAVAANLASAAIQRLIIAGVKGVRIGMTRHTAPDLKALGEALARSNTPDG